MRALLAALSLLCGPAWAQDNPSWFSRQHSSDGGYCCNGYDGHLYYGAYTIDPDGGVTLPTPDGDNHVPPEKVLPFNPNDPNPTGTAVIWYGGAELGADTFVYCFALGPLT